MTDSLKFGTSGLRGLARDLEGEASARYAAAFVRYLAGRGPVRALLVGRDLRASSPAIAASVAAGAGVPVIDCGELPTPALAFEAMRLGLPAIMVTGSHIPAERNGMKFYRADGEIDKQDEQGILAALDAGGVSRAGPVTAEPGALARYRARYGGLAEPGFLRGRRIGVWQHSSVARDLLVEVLGGYGAEIVPLGRSEVFVPVDTEAVPADVAAKMAGWVAAHRLDALVSTDGDADRPLLVDENGALVRGDLIGVLAARYLGADSVVTPVTSNSAIEGTGFFSQVIRTRVGSPYVIEGMAQGAGIVAGFEANGGLLLGSDINRGGATLTALPTRDALLPLLAVLASSREAGQTLSAFIADSMPARHARSDRLEHVPSDRSALLLARLEDDAAGFLAAQGEVAAVSRIDGLRYELVGGDVIHYRPSGNAPELRCYTEAGSAARADALLEWGLRAAEAVVR
jgi:phosphomannomutase